MKAEIIHKGTKTEPLATQKGRQIFHKNTWDARLRYGVTFNNGWLQIYCWVWQLKNSENKSAFGKVMGHATAALLWLTAKFFVPSCRHRILATQKLNADNTYDTEGYSKLSEEKFSTEIKSAQTDYIPAYLKNEDNSDNFCIYTKIFTYSTASDAYINCLWNAQESTPEKNCNRKTSTQQLYQVLGFFSEPKLFLGIVQ